MKVLLRGFLVGECEDECGTCMWSACAEGERSVEISRIPCRYNGGAATLSVSTAAGQVGGLV